MSLDSEPVMMTFYFRVEHGEGQLEEGQEFQKTAIPGVYSTLRSIVTINPSAPAEIIEKSEIKPPKVRKGTILRYRNSRWEKYTASGGWQIA